MTEGDTQWPRFEVFQQASADSRLENCGSVHAPDAEVALQNARDVFVRRPQTATLWVAPAAAILSVTREELAALPSAPAEDAAGGPEETYHVFTKSSQRRSMTFVSYRNDVTAATPRQALQLALAENGAEDAYVWWIVPAAAVTRSRPEDASMLFDPAHDKSYRLPGAYHTRTLMEEIRQQQTETDGAADD
jgi:ring-1,2-phenylacetyl-CoA epoxidase subunit PaaB